MIVNFHIRKYIRKYEDLTLKQVEKEEIESAVQRVFGDVELLGTINIYKGGQ